ncbi:TlpA disulfide reductase family protein [Flavihumibacter sp. CACIAM 22H1]|uniref:TlpA disulfide reductase family protein n=1 Tax=Flavihumibacter sp. CACIAM 22H1 TaxID=1812911 RepID=UPI000A4F9965|nr:TlpA disulfide reductase family protein [Flavihumibacter sp. CACIAM 22H1]
MKYITSSLWLCFLTAFVLPSFAQEGSFQISGNVKGLPDKSLVAITDPDRPGDTLAKAVSKKEQFELKGKLAEVKLYHISFLPSDKKGLLFLDAKKMQVSGDINAIQQLSLTGSQPHEGFVAFQKQFEPFFRQYAQLSETANRSGVTDSLMQQYKQLINDLSASAVKFAEQRKDQVVAPFMWATILQVVENPDLVEQSFNTFSPAVQASFYGQFLAGRLADAKIGRVGSEALDFSQADPNGKPISLSSFRGKYVLVDFWASWCGPCRQENPNLVEAHEKFKNKNFTVLGVSLDNNKEKWLKAITDDKLDWAQVSDLKHWQNEVALKYKVQSIPQNLLIDPKGIIIAKNLRGPDLQAKLCELLGCEGGGN